MKNESECESTELHIFTDASGEAYGACGYVRHHYVNGSVSCRLVRAQGKVAPLQAVSKPRLELMAAVHGVRLGAAMATVLEVDIKNVVFWCDSINVLYWIKTRSRSLRSFVANRVAEIQSYTLPSQWRHVPTKLNPADLVSRGCTVRALIQNTQWWNGPQFLKESREKWPERKVDPPAVETMELKRGTEEGNFCMFSAEPMETVLDPERYSKWSHLLRLMAWVIRFLENCKRCRDGAPKLMGELTVNELEDAKEIFVRQAQHEAFGEEIAAIKRNKPLPPASKIRSLQPRRDESGILRCGGRLGNAESLPHDRKHPIVLPRRHSVTRLIVRHYHEQCNHAAGVNHLLALISGKFWIIATREEIREGERACNTCKRRKAKPATQVMAPLPSARVNTSMRAFTRVSIDYGGPFLTMQGRGRSRVRRYLCLFTCMSTRAVHLEMAYGLDTDSFLNAFNRMINRRGYPEEVFSDNGSNFVGADRELSGLVRNLEPLAIRSKTVCYGVTWHFNPPLAPHFGGVHEARIKSAKRAVSAILKHADVTDEELQTAFCGAEALINSRPLTYQSADHLDELPLTPNNFLHGQAGGTLAPELIDDQPFSLRQRWRRVQELIRHFWRRWMREFLPTLSTASKWFAERRNLTNGDVVLVVDPDTPRGKWPLGRISAVRPGGDGKVRVVDVRLQGGKLLRRAICRICPLWLGVE